MTGLLIGVIAGVTAALLLGVGVGLAFALSYLCRTRGDYYTQVRRVNLYIQYTFILQQMQSWSDIELSLLDFELLFSEPHIEASDGGAD